MSGARTVPISQEHIDRLSAGTKGQGGFQNFCQRLLDNVSDGNLTVTEELAAMGDRYASQYGHGGWEDLLRELGFDVR